jgi:hypothetical protein
VDTHRNFFHFLAIISVLCLATLACRMLTFSQGGEDEPTPICTPPPCARNENYACQGDCPGGCGTFCAMFTPAPELMYPIVELVDIALSDHTLEIRTDVPRIEGEFYGVVARENYECGIWQPDQFPERLTCTGNLWFSEGTQTLRVYRTSDDQQALSLEFMIP